jgi:hypothetical protein
MDNDITEAGYLHACLFAFRVITFSTDTTPYLLTTNSLQLANNG